MKPGEVVLAAGVAGGAAGAALDVAAAGLTFGIFSTIGGFSGRDPLLLVDDAWQISHLRGYDWEGIRSRWAPRELCRFSMYCWIGP